MKTFASKNFDAKIRSARWMNNGEKGRFRQSKNKSLLTLDCTGYRYGNDLVVRGAEFFRDTRMDAMGQEPAAHT